MSAAPPNLLIFMVDQWRYDAAGHVGNPILRTPNLDRLAAETVGNEGIRQALLDAVQGKAAPKTALEEVARRADSIIQPQLRG